MLGREKRLKKREDKIAGLAVREAERQSRKGINILPDAGSSGENHAAVIQGGPLVSVIVPIYMIDRYIGHCIESITEQTYHDLEIILVDDGSPDRAPQICDLYARKDARIKVIHKENGGLVSARKAGLAASTGEYVTYVDGDDWIGPGHIGSMVAMAETTGADMVCCGFTRNLSSRIAELTNAIPAGLYEGDSLKGLWRSMLSCGSFYRPGIYTYVWNKLFCREVLEDAQNAVDDRISIGEDAAVTYPALLRCRRVAVTEYVAYHYRQREDSMLKQKANYSDEAKKLRFLCDFMMKWAKTTPPELGIREQLTDYLLSNAIIRSGGRMPDPDDNTDAAAFLRGKKVALYGAGTFGQQIYAHISSSDVCEVTAWVDDYCQIYRRVCMDVDPVESLADVDFDIVLLAAIDMEKAAQIERRLLDLGIEKDRIVPIRVPDEGRSELLNKFLE